MDIKAIKLVTGEEILTEVESLTEDKVVVLNPVVPRMMSAEQIEFMPWFQLADAGDPAAKQRSFSIELKHTVNISPAMKQLSDLYDKEFGVGLVIPDSTIKLA